MSPKERVHLKNKKLVKQLDEEEKQREKSTSKQQTNHPISNTNDDLEVGEKVRIKNSRNLCSTSLRDI